MLCTRSQGTEAHVEDRIGSSERGTMSNTGKALSSRFGSVPRGESWELGANNIPAVQSLDQRIMLRQQQPCHSAMTQPWLQGSPRRCERTCKPLPAKGCLKKLAASSSTCASDTGSGWHRIVSRRTPVEQLLGREIALRRRAVLHTVAGGLCRILRPHAWAAPLRQPSPDSRRHGTADLLCSTAPWHSVSCENCVTC